MEKRLYNRGYHIEHKRTFQSNNSVEPETPVFDPEETAMNESNNDLLSEDDFSVSEIEPTIEVRDSTVLVYADNRVEDTVYVDDYEYNKGIKMRRLFWTGVPMLGTGLIAASLLSTATSAGANLFEFIVIGALGWFFVAIAAVFLVAFIVFLCIPANSTTKKSTQEINQKNEPHKKSKLSKGEKAALVVCLLGFGIIGLLFLFGGLK